MDLVKYNQQQSIQKRMELPEHLTIKPTTISHRIKKDIKDIYAITVTPDGIRLAGISNNLVVVYDVLDETEITRYDVTGGMPTSVNISHSGKLLGIGTSEGEVIIYDIDKKAVIQRFQHLSSVNSVHLNENSKVIAAACQKNVFVNSLCTGSLIHDFEIGFQAKKISIHAEENYLYAQSSYRSELYDIKSGKIVARLSELGREGPFQIPACRYVMLNIIKNEVILWDITTNAQTHFIHPSSVCAADLNLEDESLATTCMDEKVRIFDINLAHAPLKVFLQPDSEGYSNNIANITGRVIFGCDMMRVLDKKTGSLIAQIAGHSSPLITACLSGDGQHLYAGGYDATLKCYNLQTGRQVGSFERHSSWISSVALNEEKNMVATGSHDSTAKLYNLSGRLIHTLKGHEDCVHSVSIQPSGKLIATGARDQNVMLWDSKTGMCIRSWRAHLSWVRSVVFDSTGQQILTGGKDGIARLWTLDGSLIQEYGYHNDDIYSAVFSPDRGYIATASHDTTFKLYDIKGQLLRVFEGHKGGVREVFWHVDGTIISVSLDQSAKRWDPVTGKCIQTYRADHTDWIRCVWVRSDSVLIMGSKDGTISFSDLETGKHLASLINTEKGFLWTTPPDDIAKSGWIWTDREDLVETIEIDNDGKVTQIDQDSDSSRNYISTYNSMHQIANRLRKETESSQFKKLLELHTDIKNSQTTHKLLGISPKEQCVSAED